MEIDRKLIFCIIFTVVPIILLAYYGFKSSYPFDLMDVLRSIKYKLFGIKKEK